MLDFIFLTYQTLFYLTFTWLSTGAHWLVIAYIEILTIEVCRLLCYIYYIMRDENCLSIRLYISSVNYYVSMHKIHNV